MNEMRKKERKKDAILNILPAQSAALPTSCSNRNFAGSPLGLLRM
jgi:hypothetical protein